MKAFALHDKMTPEEYHITGVSLDVTDLTAT